MADLNTSISPAPVVSCLTKGRNVSAGYTGNVTVALASNPTGATLGGTKTVAAVAGVATFSNLTLNRSGKDFTLRATGTGSGIKAVTSSRFTISTSLTFTTQPVGGSAGVVMPSIVVTAKDGANNTDTNYAGIINVSLYSGSAAGVLSGTTSKTAVAGVATFNDLSIDLNGDYTLYAVGTEVATAYPPSSKVSNEFSIETVLAFTTQPANTVANATMANVVVAVKNGAGTTITTFTGNVTVAIATNPGGGTLSGTKTVAAVAGVATFSTLAINNAGTGYTLSAASTGLTTVNSNTFNITPAAYSYSLVSGSGSASEFGYEESSYGLITPTTQYPPSNPDINIQIFMTDTAGPNTLLRINGSVPGDTPQNLFNHIVINSFTLNSASATYTSLGPSTATWEWAVSAIPTDGVTYPFTVTP